VQSCERGALCVRVMLAARLRPPRASDSHRACRCFSPN
jgi:hypothetical protein